MRILLATLFGIASANIAQAQFASGNRWNELCPNEGQAHFCVGYVAGVIDWHDGQPESERHFCLPQSVTLYQAYEVARQYIDDHPEDWHVPAAYLVTTGLGEAFPC